MLATGPGALSGHRGMAPEISESTLPFSCSVSATGGSGYGLEMGEWLEGGGGLGAITVLHWTECYGTGEDNRKGVLCSGI